MFDRPQGEYIFPQGGPSAALYNTDRQTVAQKSGRRTRKGVQVIHYFPLDSGNEQ